MEIFSDLFENRVLWITLLSWFIAQSLKVVIHMICYREFSVERMVGTGGMPSSHSATVCGLTAAIARVYGLASPIFALALIFSAVVMYDATGVRRAAGEQAKVLNHLLHERNRTKEEYQKEAQKALKELLGHTPLEVLAGALLGAILGMILPVN